MERLKEEEEEEEKERKEMKYMEGFDKEKGFGYRG